MGIDERVLYFYVRWKRNHLLLEFTLNKKRTRHTPHHAVPEERVVTIKMKQNLSARSGLSWSPEVAEFYMELYPHIIENGFDLQFDADTFNIEDLL